MPRGSSAKRERQYEHIVDAERDRGVPEGRAEEIAARTVNKQRARSGEAQSASRLSKSDISSQRRAGYPRRQRPKHSRTFSHDQSAAPTRGRVTLSGGSVPAAQFSSARLSR